MGADMFIHDQAGLQAGFTVSASLAGPGNDFYVSNTQVFNDGTQSGYQFTTPGILQMPEHAKGAASVWVTIYSTTQTP